MPARIIRSSTSGEFDAGPIVAMIRVLLDGNLAGSGDCIMHCVLRALPISPNEAQPRAVLSKFALPLPHRVRERGASASDGLTVQASGLKLAGEEIGQFSDDIQPRVQFRHGIVSAWITQLEREGSESVELIAEHLELKMQSAKIALELISVIPA